MLTLIIDINWKTWNLVIRKQEKRDTCNNNGGQYMLDKFCLSNDEMSFVESAEFCNKIGAHFPQITSEEMNNVISSISKPIKCINKITQDEYMGCQVSS